MKQNDKHKFVERKNYVKRSNAVTFIGGFYIFGGVVVLLSLLFNGSPLNIVFGVPSIPDYIVKLLVGFIYIPLGYLYVKRVKFSNWIILIFAILFFCISADLSTRLSTQPYVGNMIYSLFVIIITIIKRKEFINNIRAICTKNNHTNSDLKGNAND